MPSTIGGRFSAGWATRVRPEVKSSKMKLFLVSGQKRLSWSHIEKAKGALGSLLDTGRVKLLFMDQTDLSSVRACAEGFLKQSSKLNVIINNAAASLHGFSVHPGASMSPNLQKHSQEEMKSVLEDKRAMAYLSSLRQACATSIYGAVSSELEGRGGLYLEGASVAIHPTPLGGDALEYGYGSWAFDQAKEEELWKLSKSWVGVE
ncbi:unnamed protein product [Penicillium discolor]